MVTAYTNHLVSHANLCDLWQGKTDNLEPLPFPDDGFEMWKTQESCRHFHNIHRIFSKSEHSSHTEYQQPPKPKKTIGVWLILNYHNNQSTIAIAMCGFRQKKLKEADRASFCARCEYFWVELSLVSTFHSFPGLAPSFCHPNQNFLACFWIILKLEVSPAQFSALIPSPETKVKGKEPSQCTLKCFAALK